MDGRDGIFPVIVAASGALVGAGMGFGIPGAIVCALVGFWAGWDSQKEDNTRG